MNNVTQTQLNIDSSHEKSVSPNSSHEESASPNRDLTLLFLFAVQKQSSGFSRENENILKKIGNDWQQIEKAPSPIQRLTTVIRTEEISTVFDPNKIKEMANRELLSFTNKHPKLLSSSKKSPYFQPIQSQEKE